MIPQTRAVVASILAISALAMCQACAQIAIAPEQGRIEWREFASAVNGKHLRFRFPVEDGPQTRLEFDPAPIADRYTQSFGIIGVQVGVDIGWRVVSSAYSISLALSPARSPAIGRARAGGQLAQALERHRKETAGRADGAAFLPVEQDVVHLGQVDWVRIRFAENFGTRSIAWDDYYKPWDEGYLLHLQIRYGTPPSGDTIRIAVLRKLAEEAIASLQVQ